MSGKKILKITPPSIQKFDLEDTGKLVAVIAASKMTRESKFTELNDAMREYHEVFGHELQPIPREPVLSDFYIPTDEQHYRELGFIALSMIGIGGILYYLES